MFRLHTCIFPKKLSWNNNNC